MKHLKEFEQFNVEPMNEELSPATFRSAIQKTRQRGQFNRAYGLGKLFFNEFIGKSLFRDGVIVNGENIFSGVIKEIGSPVRDPDGDDQEIQITVEGCIGEPNGKKKEVTVFYNIAEDMYSVDKYENKIDRRDARLLSQIAMKVNPETKYKTAEYFKIKGY